MASWMVHLRIADALLDRIKGLCPVEFVVGNIAPDSGVPNEDWSVFTPSTHVSHFKRVGSKDAKDIDINAYLDKYWTAELRQSYCRQQESFYLGYLTHLLTDVLWSRKIAKPSVARYPEEAEKDRTALIWKLKRDWYDLDHKFLRDHPGFRAFEIYRNAVGFRNTYMDIFSEDALDNRREYITAFYDQHPEGLDREYPYLTEAAMNRFVEEAVEQILLKIT